MIEKLNSIKKEELEGIVEESISFPDVCRRLGFDPKVGNIKVNVERKIKRLNISVLHFTTIKKVNASKTRYNREVLIKLVNNCNSFKEILLGLDLLPVETNYRKLKSKLKEFNIDYYKFSQKSRNNSKYTKEDVQRSVLESKTISESLVRLKIRNAGGNYKTFHKLIELYDIDISHFDPNYNRKNTNSTKGKNTSEYLIENCNYSRTNLKRRLYKEELLKPICCICGQDENWNGIKISLILDHINGIHNDNRIKNLRIVCPNCNAGLDTFAGRNNKKKMSDHKHHCKCGEEILKNSKSCRSCFQLNRRKVNRPSIEILTKEVNEFGYSATGKKYGVSDNSIRKWLKAH